MKIELFPDSIWVNKWIVMVGLLACFTHVSSADGREGCTIDKFSVDTLLISNKSNCGGLIKAKGIRKSLEVVDYYWNGKTSNKQRYALLGQNYKDQLSQIYSIKKGDDYRIPGSEWERTWTGYFIEKVEIYSSDLIQVETILRWQQEGNEGVQSYLFGLKKEHEEWEIVAIYK